MQSVTPQCFHVSCCFTVDRALARATATSLLFAFPSHVVDSFRLCKRRTLLADAAPCNSRFRVGLVGSGRLYKHVLCPEWVHTLQQAELYAAYFAIKMAAYNHES